MKFWFADLMSEIWALVKRIPVMLIVCVVLAVVLLLAVSQCSTKGHEAKVEKANNRTLENTIVANEAASEEQLVDQKTVEDMKEAFDEAIHESGDGSVPAWVRHACEQLRQDGYREADLPAQCGRAGAGRPD